MITFDEALAIVAAHAVPLGSEPVALAQASGRVLAEPVVARVDSPPIDVSAMDGYAVRTQDLPTGERFRVVDTAYPGQGCDRLLGSAECVRIFTGAPTPPQDCSVILQEDVRREGDVAVVTLPATARKRHVRARGSDFRTGDTLLPAGHRLDPRALVVAAGADLAELRVWRQPRVALIGTGDELVAPGDARDRPHSIPESVSFGVAAFAERMGAVLGARMRIGDDLAALEAGASRALDTSDLVVMTGGASVGEKDFAKRVFLALGAEMLFSKVAIMPGKPVWFARRGSTSILGLPGNPTSAMVTARLFLAPLLGGMTGLAPAATLRWRSAPLTAPLEPGGDRETFVRARHGDRGVSPLRDQGSGLQLMLASADVLIRRAPHAPALAAGAPVDITDF